MKNFIKEAEQKHNSLYDYSKTSVKNSEGKVEIICKKHGSFWQTPYVHLNCKTPCLKCVNESFRVTFLSFEERALKRHKFKYFYPTPTTWKGIRSKIKVICPKHGAFKIQANVHLHCKTGYPKCFENYSDVKIFKKRALKTHGNLYDYSQVVYINAHSKVKIVCKTHGLFKQSPTNHLSGNGCLGCFSKRKSSHGEVTIMSILEELKISYIKEHKFAKLVNPKTGKQLRFDFYLPDYNICIEFDGFHHFKENTFKNASLKDQKYRDELKNNFCKNEKIPLLRIKYNIKRDFLQREIKTFINKLKK